MTTLRAHQSQRQRRAPRRDARAPVSQSETPNQVDSIAPHEAAFIEPDQRHAKIAEAAYYLAEQRGFDPGYEIEDWLAAEREIERVQAAGEPSRLCGD